MSKIDDYRAALRALPDWEPFLLEHSGLPGPRGNLELAQAAADVGEEALFAGWRSLDPRQAPENTPQAFLAFVGVLSLGQALAARKPGALETLRPFAADPRWRIREAVAMALQRWGDGDLEGLLEAMEAWSQGSRFEQRAAMAAVCEPRLLAGPAAARRALALLDAITVTIPGSPDRKTEGFQALKKGLGYGWSVAAAALPEAGRPLLEKWLASPDPDVAWIMRENLKKKRIAGWLLNQLD